MATVDCTNCEFDVVVVVVVVVVTFFLCRALCPDICVVWVLLHSIRLLYNHLK